MAKVKIPIENQVVVFDAISRGSMKKVTQVEKRQRYPITFSSDEEALSLSSMESAGA